MTDVGLDVVRFVYQMLQIDPEWAVSSDRGFTWWAGSLAQYVWAEPSFEDDGFNVARIHVRTDLIDGFSGTDAHLLQLMELSYFATLSGPIRNPANSSRVQLAASVYVHSGTSEWLQRVLAWVAAIQNAEAHSLAPGVAEFTEARLAVSKHPNSGRRSVPDDMLNIVRAKVQPEGQHPSPYAGDEMLDTLALFQNPPCVLATGDEDGLSAEFPFGDFTSLLQMKTSEVNPGLGHGLLTLLSLPGTETGKENVKAARLALELNELELSSLTRFHFLGSWCPGKQALTFASFLPNAMRLAAGLPSNLIGFPMMMRAAWAAAEVYRVGFDYHQATASKAERMELLARAAEEQAGKGKGERAQRNPPSRKQSRGSGQKRAATLLEQVRAETQGDCRRPCTPFAAAPFVDAAKEIVPLLSSGIFNPCGPTLKTILIARPAAGADWLLVDVHSNPFAPTKTTGRGWQPATVDPVQLAALLAGVEAAQASESDFLLTQSTYVVVPLGAQPGAAVWKEVFRRALIREGATGLGAVCRSIRANWCRPWDRTKEELGGNPAEARRDRPLTAADYYAWWEAMVVAMLNDPHASARMTEAVRLREGPAPMTAAEFEDWWQLVTHSAHIAHEVKELPHAWRGALAQAPGVAQQMGGDPASIQFHWRILQPVLTPAGRGTGPSR
jgi:hypothetical protein